MKIKDIVIMELTEPLPDLNGAKSKDEALQILEEAGWYRADDGEGMAEEWHRDSVPWSACITHETNANWAAYVSVMANNGDMPGFAKISGAGRKSGFEYAYVERFDDYVHGSEALLTFCVNLIRDPNNDIPVFSLIDENVQDAMRVMAKNLSKKAPALVRNMGSWIGVREDGSHALTEPK